MDKNAALRISSLALLGLAALALSAAPALALSSRTFVSAKGTDSGACGAVASPCRTFQTAHDNTTAGGQIDVLDSGDYGPVDITKSIGIVNDGAGTARSSGVAITAGVAGAVHLRGLAITGGPFLGGTGIEASNLASLTIVNCVVRGGASIGIRIRSEWGPASFSISHTIAENNGSDGIQIATSPPAGSAVGFIDHVLVHNNFHGVDLSGANVKATIADSVLSSNIANGLVVQNGASATVRHVAANQNRAVGFWFSGGVSRIAHSTAVGNGVGVTGAGISINGGAIVESYGDNDVRGNPVQVAGSLTPVAKQ